MAESAAYSRRGFQGGCVATTVPSGLASGATSAVLADASTWAGLLTNGNARLMLGRTTATPEEIEISGLAGNTITIAARGLQNTSDTTHAAGVSIEVIHSPRDFNEANAHIADTTLDHHTQYVKKSLYDANSILAATSDDTPVALTMGASTILARLASGDIVAATPAQLRTLLSLVIGTDVQAWDADLDDLAAIADATGDIIIRGASGWERLAKSATATDLLAAGATKPEWVASAGLVQNVVKASDESVTSSTTLQNDDELLLALAASTDYSFEAFLHVTAGGATPDFKAAFTVPTGASLLWTATCTTDTGAVQAVLSGNPLPVAASGTSVTWDTDDAGARIVRVFGSVRNGVNAGNLTLQWAQVVSDAAAVTVKAGSWLTTTETG